MAEEITFRPNKALLAVWLFLVVLVCAVAGGAGAGVAVDMDLDPLLFFLVGWAAAVVPVGGWAVLYFNSIVYHIDDHYVTRSHGVLWTVRRSIPLEKITNIDVRRGPLERVLGIGQVWIFTPSTGGQMPEQKIIGVTNADEVKQTIVRRSEAAREAAAEDDEAQALRPTDEVVALLKEILLVLRNIQAGLDDNGAGPSGA